MGAASAGGGGRQVSRRARERQVATGCQRAVAGDRQYGAQCTACLQRAVAAGGDVSTQAVDIGQCDVGAAGRDAAEVVAGIVHHDIAARTSGGQRGGAGDNNRAAAGLCDVARSGDVEGAAGGDVAKRGWSGGLVNADIASRGDRATGLAKTVGHR